MPLRSIPAGGDKSRMQPGLTLVNFSNHSLGAPIIAAVIDPLGKIIWSHRRWHDRRMWGQTANVPDLRGDIDVRTTEEGFLIGGTNISQGTARVHAVLVSWQGELLWECPVINHHHIHRNSEGNYVFLLDDKRCFEKFCGKALVGDQIVEWNPKRNSLVWAWHLFYHQHSPQLQPNGNILLFDNGTARPEEHGGQFSRALELMVDEKTMKAKAVWSYRHAPDLFCPIWSDADRLPNGNTLITFGTRTDGDTTRYVEVTPDGVRTGLSEY